MLTMFCYVLNIWLLIISALVILPSVVSAQESVQATRLVLQITVDQLRGDLPFRYHERFCEGGFGYLTWNGMVFRDAHHRHANTETIVGHTSTVHGSRSADTRDDRQCLVGSYIRRTQIQCRRQAVPDPVQGRWRSQRYISSVWD